MGKQLSLTRLDEAEGQLIGTVDVGSTDQSIVFTATSPLVVGDAVAVQPETPNESPILFQVTGAEVKERSVKGGSYLTVKTTARQIGIFDAASQRLNRHRWVAQRSCHRLPPTGCSSAP